MIRFGKVGPVTVLENHPKRDGLISILKIRCDDGTDELRTFKSGFVHKVIRQDQLTPAN